MVNESTHTNVGNDNNKNNNTTREVLQNYWFHFYKIAGFVWINQFKFDYL